MTNKNLFNWLLFFGLIINVSYFKLIIDPKFFGWLSNFAYLAALFLIPTIARYGTRACWSYVLVMLSGLLLHLYFSNIKNPINDASQWIFIAVLFMASRRYESSIIVSGALYLFFTAHCLVAFYEYLNQEVIFNFAFLEVQSSYFTDVRSFRAFGLMEHPLYSANILVIFLAFIMTARAIPPLFRFSILFAGSIALLSFNARAAIVVWLTLLVFEFLRVYKIFGSLVMLILAGIVFGEIPLNVFVDLSFLGRLGEFGFSDDSSLGRVISYVVFFNESWSLEEFVIGGRVMFLPGSGNSLESGLLLTIAWWGWIVGLLKIFLELVISYQSVSYLSTSDRYIVMIAGWLTAFANNNSINTFVLFFILICSIVFKVNKSL